MRNLLLPPPPREDRCTGRTTAIALDLISRALAQQGKVCYAVDHHRPGTPAAAEVLYVAVSNIIEKLGLEHIKCSRIVSGGPYDGHVRLVSEIWVN